MDTKKLLGFKVKEIRKQRKITQEKLSELIGVDNGYISKLEVGQNFPSLKTLEKISLVLDVSLGEFFKFESDSRINYKEEINKIYDRLSGEMQHRLYQIARDLE